MKSRHLLCVLPLLALIGLNSCTTSSDEHHAEVPTPKSAARELAQVPTWSHDDLEFFLHGSMSSEIVPETVLRAFIAAYPDLFPSRDFSHLGAIPDTEFGWPIGFTRSKPAHLGGVTSVGLNCASCHVGEIAPPDVESFFGTVVLSPFRTTEPANMKKFLTAYLSANDPQSGEAGADLFGKEWERQKEKI